MHDQAFPHWSLLFSSISQFHQSANTLLYTLVEMNVLKLEKQFKQLVVFTFLMYDKARYDSECTRMKDELSLCHPSQHAKDN
jgi:hypothetical protein